MSSKRKWDQPAPDADDGEGPAKVAKTDASEAAAAAAAIAAKIAAQFGTGSLGSPGGGGSGMIGAQKDMHDGEFTHDIDINDQRNRYMLTKGPTQLMIHEETGASVGTKGVWYPDRSKATEKDPPLYLHISANTPEILQAAIEKVNELINIDMGSLVEEKKDRQRERRKWPEEKIPVGIDTIRNFNVRAKVVGPSGMFVKYIQQETQTRVQIKGLGSGFVDQETGRESEEPMHIHITGPDESQVARAKVLTDDLLEVVKQEHAKVKVLVTQQQMELHHAQQQYAAYSAYGGYAPPAPSGAPPPPPPGEAPPPPPSDGSAQPPAPDGSQYGQAAGPPAVTDTAAYAAYWAGFGYDVNSPEFKEWQEQQQQQYAQYYASQGYGAPAAAPAGGAPEPGEPAPPPPPPS
ncbi:hypothetical protein PLICRDRAFT_37964 [Plicaturopsis crispa FD-325 SS-3]|nr:hypothetical protein PLICRDRAFT_37964 [Plicaturopsis crispa FD-325 SS-3]